MLNSRFTRDALKPHQPRGMGRGLSLAVLVHVGLIIAIAIGVSWRSRTPDAVQAELWAAVPQTAAPRAAEPEPAPAPAPPPKPAPKVEEAPPPPKPVPDPQIAIEKAKQEKERQEKEKTEKAASSRRSSASARSRTRCAGKRNASSRRPTSARRSSRRRRKSSRKLRGWRRFARPTSNASWGRPPATGDARATGAAQQSAGPSASYAGRIKAAIKPKIVFADELTSNPTAEVEVRAGPDGTILGRRLIKSSNVKEWDDAVLRAIDRTEVLPRDVDGRVPPALVISFRPRD